MGAAVVIGALAVMLGIPQQVTAATQGPQVRRIVMFRRVIQMRGGENDAGELATGVCTARGVTEQRAGLGIMDRATGGDDEGSGL